ncbi:MAG: DUF4416 family protein [Planctomycetota bacterium]|nr:DUF4416 family protein [Planctomycetota bacterium]
MPIDNCQLIIAPVMGAITQPERVKLIVAMLSISRDTLVDAARRLERDFGPVDLSGEVTEFDFTHYYDEEMGAGLLRQFIALKKLITPDQIVAIKRATNDIEGEFAEGPNRTVNLDPGYITESKLILASTKDFAHRIYLSEGIYAEVTLAYVHGRWVSHPYTFPDYASGRYDEFLIQARDALRRQLGRKGHHQ